MIVNASEVIIKLDSGNTPIQKDEIIWLSQKIGEIFKERNIKITDIKWLP